MRKGIVVEVSAADRIRLEAVVADRNSPQKHVWRARIVLLTANDHGTVEIMRRAGTSKAAVWRWQERFMTAGVEGLLRDKTRPSRIPPLGADVAARVVTLTTTSDPPGETTHWTAGVMAEAVGISASAVQRIWRAHGLQPHRGRSFKLSTDPRFAEKVRAIVGLYVDPPAHAVVLSVDEKSQIQALDRTQPGLPMKKGRLATMTHDYKRNGTTTLFAALNVLDGSVIGQCMQRHRAAGSRRDPMSEGPPVSRPARRHQEFIRFLNQVERDVPAGKLIHVVLDNYATHKHPKVIAWLDRHPRWSFHFTPTSSSWLNAVEGFFAKLTNRRLKRGVFASIVDLQATINRFVAETNRRPKPFVWTAEPDKIIAAVRRGHQTLDLIH
jgi:transposase